MSKHTRIQRVINTLSKIQLEEGTHDAAIGAAKATLQKLLYRWQTQDRIADQRIVTKLAALGKAGK